MRSDPGSRSEVELIFFFFFIFFLYLICIVSSSTHNFMTLSFSSSVYFRLNFFDFDFVWVRIILSFQTRFYSLRQSLCMKLSQLMLDENRFITLFSLV